MAWVLGGVYAWALAEACLDAVAAGGGVAWALVPVGVLAAAMVFTAPIAAVMALLGVPRR